MRLIDADKLKRKCQKTATEAWKMGTKASVETTLNQFIDWIDQAEPVDAVPSATDTNVRSRATEADDLINRKDTIRAIEAEKVAHGDYTTSSYVGYEFAEEVVESMPSAQTELENKIRAIGYTGKEGRIYIGGRLFAVRELPQ